MRNLMWLLIVAGCLQAGPLWAAPAEKPKAEEIPCRRTTDQITVDGKFDEVTWQRAPAIPMIIPITDAVPISRASAKVAWDDQYLYVAFETADQDIWSTYTERDALTCTEDCFEVFLKPLADKYGYANLEINALGTVMDALPLNRIGGGDNNHRWKDWTCHGIKVGVTIQGTLNDLTDKDTGWTMEVAIPFDQLLPISGRAPRAGDVWTFLLAHYDHSVYLPGGVEADSIASLSVFSFGKSDEWRQMRFVDEIEMQQPAKVEHRKLSAREAKAQLDKDPAIRLVDVRTEQEFIEKRIAGSTLIPDYEIETQAPKLLPDKNEKIFIYCRSGRRSYGAAMKLVEMGYTNVYDFGGIIDWPYETVAGK